MFSPVFSNQKSYENVLLILRKHPFVLFQIFARYFLLLVGIVAAVLAASWLLFSSVPFAIAVFLMIFILLWWGFLFRSLAEYYLDTWIVTDHRIVAVEQNSLFNRDVSELRLTNIQDVALKVEGMLPTFFNYGDVIIQTAAEIPEFHFLKVPNPTKVKDVILNAYDQFTRTHPNGVEVHEQK